MEDHASQRLSCNRLTGFRELLAWQVRPSSYNKVEWISNFNLDIVQLVLFQIVKTTLSPDVVIWRGLNTLLNQFRLNPLQIGYLFYLLQMFTWRPTFTLSTCDLTYHTSIYWTDSDQLHKIVPCQGVGSSSGLIDFAHCLHQSDTTMPRLRLFSLTGEYPSCSAPQESGSESHSKDIG